MQEEVKNTEMATDAEPVATEEAKKEKKKSKKSDAEVLKLKEELEAKEKEIAELNDKYLRLYAEYDNFRRRSLKERESIYFDAKSDTLKNILSILDNMERATAFTEADKILEGMNLILKSFNESFSKMDVKEIDALGKPFDPNIHYAVMHIEDESYGENEVVEVLQKGYICGDKVIRYAMVKVAN
ncbi:MAG: nucleotide exchange factor GrpE [Clostridia bacterium]|nr:nucleotide exchange factor GrpE [Clostridia bacterium]